MSERLLTPEQLAERWQVQKSQIYRLGREKKIPVVRLGKYLRFRLDHIEAWENGTPIDTGHEAA
jgi:excisionase family DNA binding protein